MPDTDLAKMKRYAVSIRKNLFSPIVDALPDLIHNACALTNIIDRLEEPGMMACFGCKRRYFYAANGYCTHTNRCCRAPGKKDHYERK